MENMAVVSLTNEHERRQHIDNLFKNYEFSFAYFDAIDKTKVTKTLKEYALKANTEKLSESEIACFLSHYCLWQQVIDQEMPYLMVFEDDIYFAKSAKILLSNLNWLPSNFDVIKLETMYERVMVNKGSILSLGHRLCQMQSRHMGMAGYIISQVGAKKLIAMTKELGIEQPVDHIMFDRLIEQKKSQVYQICPALCIQDKIYNDQSTRFGSCLEETRKPLPVVKQDFSGYKKVNKELVRVVKQLLPKNIYYSGWLTFHGYKKQKIEYHE